MATITYCKGLPTPADELNALGVTPLEMFLYSFALIFHTAVCETVNHLLSNCSGKKDFDKSKWNTSLQHTYGISKRHANGVISFAKGAVDSAKECRANHIKILTGKLKSIEAWIKKEETKLKNAQKFYKKKKWQHSKTGCGFPLSYSLQYRNTNWQYLRFQLHNKKQVIWSLVIGHWSLSAILPNDLSPMTNDLRRHFYYKDGKWCVAVQFTPAPVERVSRHYSYGCIGIDMNPGSIGWAYVDLDGNLRAAGQIPLQMGLPNGQQSEQIVEACLQLAAIAETYACPVVCEELDFSTKKEQLKERGRKYARMLSGWAYSRFYKLLGSILSNRGIYLMTVNPAYTSVIGLVKYTRQYGLASDEAAAIAIAQVIWSWVMGHGSWVMGKVLSIILDPPTTLNSIPMTNDQ